MTVAQMLDIKYREKMKKMNPVAWGNILAQPRHPAQTIYMALEITADDIRKNGGWTGELWREIDSMHKSKLLASNAHRQYSSHVTKYWLTEKGWKVINKDNAIC